MKLTPRAIGFTLVELMVVVAVLGILVSLSVFSYNGWQSGISEREVRSDLQIVVSAMSNQKNFSNGYQNEVPDNFQPSSNVSVTYSSGSSTTYCIEGTSKRFPSIIMFVREDGEVRKGTCAFGEINEFDSAYSSVAAAGGGFSCSVKDAAAYCWGSNSNGTLGDGSAVTYRTTPAKVAGLNDKTVTAVSTNPNIGCAVADAQLYCWGRNNYGQLGDGTTTNRSTPTAVTGLSEKAVTAVSASANQACAIADGAAYCWGYNYSGQLGDGTTTNRLTPTAVTGLGGAVVKSIAAGGGHTCAITVTNRLYCWGNNYYGNIGDGTTTNRLTPTYVSSLGENVTAVAAQSAHTCAIAASELKCWGWNSSGQLGDGTTTDRSTPTSVNLPGSVSTKVTYVSAGYHGNTCAVADSATYCWGWNGYGTLGDGTNTNRSTPGLVPNMTGKPVTAVSNGQTHTCAYSQGDIYCWGSNDRGQFGSGSTTAGYNLATKTNAP